jgi:ABC-type glycerol-3-phosphate transport system substrate-binding protein
MDWYASTGKLLGGPDKVTSFTNLFTGGANPFYEEQVAIGMQGEYNPVTWPDQAPKSMANLALAWLPTAEGVPYGSGQTDGGNVFVLPKGVKNGAESMDFLSYMAGPDAVLRWNVEENNLPPVKSVAFDDKFISATPLQKIWIDLLKQDKMAPAVTSPLAPQFADEQATAVQEVIYGKKTSKQALTDLNQKLDKMMAQFKASHPNW